MTYNTIHLNIIKRFAYFFAAFWAAGVNGSELMLGEEIEQPSFKMAAGVLPFFDDGKTVLLGKEFRKRGIF